MVGWKRHRGHSTDAEKRTGQTHLPGTAHRAIRAHEKRAAPGATCPVHGGSATRGGTSRTPRTRGSGHESTRLPRARAVLLGGRARPRHPGRHRRHRPRRHGHHLRHRSAHPQGRRARGTPGTVLGHEAVGESSRSAATYGPCGRGPGAGLLHPACGRCRFCREGRTGSAGAAGAGSWATFDGTQAEYVRVPFADLSAHPLPSRGRRQVRGAAGGHLPDRLRGGRAQRPGLARATPSPSSARARSAWRRSRRPSLFAPSRIIAVDLAPSRLDAAKQLGADAVADAARGPRAADRRPHRRAGRRCGDRGRGVPEPSSSAPAGAARRPGRQRRRARQARDAAPRGPVDQERHDHHRAGRHVLHAHAAVDAGRGQAAHLRQLVTHLFQLDQMEEAYDVFARSADTGALKVAIGGHAPPLVPRGT